LVVFVLVWALFFAFLAGSHARAESDRFGTCAAGSALGWPRGGEGHRCAS